MTLLAEQGPKTRCALARELETRGIVVIPDLLEPEQLAAMQQAFDARLRQPRWNNVDGYEKTERYRHMIQDVLTLTQGFVDLALHPRLKETMRDYIGDSFALVEAKGWLSLPTKRDFHGWHGDAWYDQTKVRHIPREVKLGLYLTDVPLTLPSPPGGGEGRVRGSSGAFNYVAGSHGKQAPRAVRNHELTAVLRPPFGSGQIVEVTGRAGTAFLFDTSGIHRQSVPILEPRRAVFLNYHDPKVPLQAEDVEYYRYHPLLLNAAFLGGLTEEDQRILGFGDKTNYLEGFERQAGHRWFRALIRKAYDLKLWAGDVSGRVTGRLKRLVGRG